ncbi:hypothetical protein J3R83DRAFT_5223 [Lanmaoa asiatica]|nr:hypothetical protein J3R83DRAFT_5223 [Lanmaoa asiatica]
MLAFTSSNIIAMSIIVYLCIIAPSASGKIRQGTAGMSRYRTDASRAKPTKPAGVPKPAHDNRHNTSSTATAARRNRNRDRSTPSYTLPRKNMTKMRAGQGKTRSWMATPTKRRRQNEQPTPEPTGDASTSTTVYISGTNAFALLLPRTSGGGYPIYSVSSFLRSLSLFAELVSDAEEDGIAYCTDGSGCGNSFPDGFITGASYSAASDGSYVQVGVAVWVTGASLSELLTRLQITGCMDTSKFPFANGDDGGQFDNRFPNGAQCTFGGYGASFIEQ